MYRINLITCNMRKEFIYARELKVSLAVKGDHTMWCFFKSFSQEGIFGSSSWRLLYEYYYSSQLTYSCIQSQSKRKRNIFVRELSKHRQKKLFLVLKLLPWTTATAAKEHVEKIHRAMKSSSPTSSCTLFNGRFTTVIINLSLIGVRENFICHWNLLKPFTFIRVLKDPEELKFRHFDVM